MYFKTESLPGENDVKMLLFISVMFNADLNDEQTLSRKSSFFQLFHMSEKLFTVSHMISV